MDNLAESNHHLIIELVDYGRMLIDIRRVSSPITTEKLLTKFPMRSFGRYYAGSGKDYFVIQVDVKKGAEKPSHGPFEVGEVVYEPNSDAIMICLKEGETKMVVSKLGKVIKGLGLFDKIERSCRTKMAFKKQK